MTPDFDEAPVVLSDRERLSWQEELRATRNQSIRAEHAIKQLTAELRELREGARREADRRRFQSATAYVLFVLIIVGAALLYTRVEVQRAERQSMMTAHRIAELEEQLRMQRSENARIDSAHADSWSFYELIAAGRREEAVERFPAVEGGIRDRAALEMFRREVTRYRSELAAESYATGNRYFESQQWSEARDAYARSLAYVAQAPYTPDLSYKLAESLYSLRDYAAAAIHYEVGLDSDNLSRQAAAIGLFRMAESWERSANDERALESYRLFIQRHGRHAWAPTAEARISLLQRRASRAAQPELPWLDSDHDD